MPSKTIELTVDQWIEIPNNPCQRNTDKRVKMASGGHLKESSYEQSCVYAATLNGEIICKEDGHTRAMLWQRGELARPTDNKVTVFLIPVSSWEEAGKLHSHFDSRMANKRPYDLLYGSSIGNGIYFQSPLLEPCNFMDQFNMIEPKETGLIKDHYELIKKWKPCLVALDSMGMTNRYSYLTGFMLVALHNVGINPVRIYFDLLYRNKGIKDAKGYDGVEILKNLLSYRKVKKEMKGHSNMKDIYGRAWTAFHGWRNSKTFSNYISSNTDFTEYVNKECMKPVMTPYVDLASSTRPYVVEASKKGPVKTKEVNQDQLQV